LVAALKESFAVCDVAFDALTDAKASDMIDIWALTLRTENLGTNLGQKLFQ
jgi:hypothetical protein